MTTFVESLQSTLRASLPSVLGETHLDAFQKNVDTLKSIKSPLGG